MNLMLHLGNFCIFWLYSAFSNYYRVGKSTNHLITGRNEVVAKVMFLQVSVIHSVHRGGLQRTPPGPRRTPLGQGRTPPGTKAGRQVVGQVKKVGKSRNFYQKVGKSRNFSTKK